MLLDIANFFARWTLLFQSMKKSHVLVFVVRTLKNSFKGWGLVKRFTVISTIIMFLGMVGIGRWVGEHIKAGVLKEATATTALYMDSFIAPNIQELGQSNTLTPEHSEVLNNLFSATNLGQRTVSIKIWNRDYEIVYSNILSLEGRSFSNNTDLIDPLQGKVTGDISNLQDAENIEERRLSSEPLLEIYSPVRLNGTNQIIAVAEFYQKIDSLETEIIAAQRRGWLMVGATMTVIYLLLIGFVRWAGNRIEQQELELKNQVTRLTELLGHNKDLNRRVRLAAANTATLNESLLRRTSAELHDGPVQEIGLALLRLDQAIAQNENCRFANPMSLCNQSLPTVQTKLQSALKEMRAIAAGLGLPQLEELTLTEVVMHVVRSHEQRTRMNVELNMQDLPEQVSLPIKITMYRFIQEGLNNAYLHASGKDQVVKVMGKPNQIQIEVSDQGPGINGNVLFELDNHLGLAGMRERVESLGGLFTINSNIEKGTELIARLPLQNTGEITNG